MNINRNRNRSFYMWCRFCVVNCFFFCWSTGFRHMNLSDVSLFSAINTIETTSVK